MSDLATALGYAQLPDPYELVDDDTEDPAGAASFVRQLVVAAERLVGLARGADVVAERGPVDLLAYLEALAELGRSSVGPDLMDPAACHDRRGDGARRPARRRAARCRVTASPCPTTRTRTCARRWTPACSTCVTTPTWSARPTRVVEVAGAPEARLEQLLAAVTARGAD